MSELVFHMVEGALDGTELAAREDRYTLLKDAGFHGLQHHVPVAAARTAGLELSGAWRITEPRHARKVAELHRSQGFVCTTLHVGTGLERDAELDALAAAVIDASVATGHPLYVETHRATITQDIRRTLDLVERFPELRFNADLSHWYTGHELTYGDVEAKLELLEPVFERVRFLHGRIGNSCVMQLPLELVGDTPRGHFEAMWRRCAAGFRRTAAPGERLVFAPELLPARSSTPSGETELNYALLCRGADGTLGEVGDRWADARALLAIMGACWDAA